jgi:dihydrofolate reductase
MLGIFRRPPRRGTVVGRGKVIVVQFLTLDGIVEDPDGSEGLPGGGWAFRSGPGRVADDDFGLGTVFDTGVLLLGRRTWDLFARRWPRRSDPFAGAMNRIPKLVVSRSAPPVDAWSNSSLLGGDLLDGVAARIGEQDIVVMGSTSVVHALAAADVVDEYRLLVMPTALGTGERLFLTPVELRLVSIATVGEAILARYERPDRS